MIRHKTRIPHAFTLTREIPHTYTTHYMYNPFTWTDFIKSRNAVHLYIFQKELPTIIPSNINTDRNQKIKLQRERINMASLLDKAKDFVADNLAGVPKPEGSVTDVDLKDVNRDSVEYLAKVSVTNPYGHAIPICEINFTIHSGGR